MRSFDKTGPSRSSAIWPQATSLVLTEDPGLTCALDESAPASLGATKPRLFPALSPTDPSGPRQSFTHDHTADDECPPEQQFQVSPRSYEVHATHVDNTTQATGHERLGSAYTSQVCEVTLESYKERTDLAVTRTPSDRYACSRVLSGGAMPKFAVEASTLVVRFSLAEISVSHHRTLRIPLALVHSVSVDPRPQEWLSQYLKFGRTDSIYPQGN
jgi:hypothetical protein